MNFWIFILLLGVCLPHWTTAGWKTYHRSEQDSKVEEGIVTQIVMTNSTHIDLSHRRIHSFGYYAFLGIKREDVKSLDLSHNNLDGFQCSNHFLPNLEILLLSHNKIASLEDSFNCYKNLKYVDVSSNPITESLTLKRNLVRGLPVSAIIYVGANELFSPRPISVPFDYEENRLQDLPFANRLYRPYAEKLRVNLCKTVDGLVKSVDELKINETLDDCIRANVISQNRELFLSKLGLKKFERNWYKLEIKNMNKLILYKNEIADITPELLNNLPSKLTFIDLRKNNIKIIRSNTIQNRNIDTMLLDNNVISTIEDRAFENTNLNALYLQGNRLDDLEFVKTLPVNMKYLILSHNFFPVIPANTFQNLRKIELLGLSGCHIETIEPGAFENIENLLMIYLAFNHISELKPQLFTGLKRLPGIDLSFNVIKKIPRDLFSGVRDRDMYNLLLGHNEIDTIEVGSFSNRTINQINLEGNKITEKSVTKGVFEGSLIRRLDLSGNLISEINESFLDIPALENLNLAKNNINNVAKDVIKNMRSLEHLNLSRNPLKHLKNGAFYRFGGHEKNIKIDLSLVPIEYIEAGVFAEVSN